jgi:hypothetical protein
MPKFSNGHGKVSEMKDLLYQFGKKYLLPVYVWTFFNRNNQTFTKLRNILK